MPMHNNILYVMHDFLFYTNLRTRRCSQRSAFTRAVFYNNIGGDFYLPATTYPNTHPND